MSTNLALKSPSYPRLVNISKNNSEEKLSENQKQKNLTFENLSYFHQEEKSPARRISESYRNESIKTKAAQHFYNNIERMLKI